MEQPPIVVGFNDLKIRIRFRYQSHSHFNIRISNRVYISHGKADY